LTSWHSYASTLLCLLSQPGRPGILGIDITSVRRSDASSSFSLFLGRPLLGTSSKSHSVSGLHLLRYQEMFTGMLWSVRYLWYGPRFLRSWQLYVYLRSEVRVRPCWMGTPICQLNKLRPECLLQSVRLLWNDEGILRFGGSHQSQLLRHFVDSANNWLL
jgi:hypothetical protein